MSVECAVREARTPAGVSSLGDLGLTRGDRVRWRSRDGGTWSSGNVVGREKDGSISLIDGRGNWRAIRSSALSVRIGGRWVAVGEESLQMQTRPRATRRSVRREERIVRDYLECVGRGRVSPVIQSKFVESARRWAEFRGITADALAAVGVPRSVLQDAGVQPMTKSFRRSRNTS